MKLEKTLSSAQYLSDPGPTIAAIHAAPDWPSLKLPILGQLPVIASYDGCSQVLKTPKLFAVRPADKASILPFWMPKFMHQLTYNMLGQDDPEHKRLRRMVDPLFKRDYVDQLRPMVEQVAHELLDEMPRNGDVLRDYARPLPMLVIAKMLGLPAADLPRVTKWLSALGGIESTTGFLRALPGLHKVSRYFADLSRRTDLPPGLFADLVTAEQDGRRLTSDELVAMVFLLFVAGHETTVHLISGGIISRDRLVPTFDITPRAIDELIRWWSPVQLTKTRFAMEDTVIDGQWVTKGTRIIAYLAAANRDPARFTNPDHFDPSRTPNPHLGFGAGPHFCLGLQLAKLETEIALTALYDRHPNLRIKGDILWKGRPGLRSAAALPVIV